MENQEQEPPPMPPQLPLEPHCKPWGFWLTLAFGLVCFGGVVMAQTIGAFIGVILDMGVNGMSAPIDLEALQYNGWVLGTAGLISLPAYLLFPILFAWLRKTIPIREYFAIRGASILNWMLWTVGFAIVVLASDYLMKLLGAPQANEWMVKAWDSAGTNVLFLLTIVVVAPIGEEWLFRGFMYKGWAEFNQSHKKACRILAIFLTSAIWAVIHSQYGWHGIVHIFILGIFLGIVRWRTNSILVPIWLHFLNNLFATLMMHFAQS